MVPRTPSCIQFLRIALVAMCDGMFDEDLARLDRLREKKSCWINGGTAKIAQQEDHEENPCSGPILAQTCPVVSSQSSQHYELSSESHHSIGLCFHLMENGNGQAWQ